ncbi:MAG: O-antigen ligase family protein [Crocinitomicaceae bacterium]|nr:O-antigen ligase family protein [Crocinitomicaceae bacterium]
MFDKWLKLPAHYYLRITALIILVVGVAVSNVLMSIGAIWIISNWLIEAKFSEYKKRFLATPEIILILIFLAYSILTIAWSDDFWYAFHDIRIKLPLLAIPLALGTGAPVEKKVLHFLLFIFIGIVAYTGAYNYLSFVSDAGVKDIREMSRFISQIRFATLVDIALFACIYLWMEAKVKWWQVIPFILFFLFYTAYAQVLNGYILFIILCFGSLVYFYFVSTRRTLRITLFTGFVIIGLFGFYYLKGIIQTYKGTDKIDVTKLEEFTANGNPYYHDTTAKQTENGHYVWLYVQQTELEKEWNERSEIAYDSLDRKGQPMFGSLMRYLTSKNVRKDSAGVASLTDEEVHKIEEGCTGVNMNSGVESKIHSFLFEYEMYQGGVDPNGFSLLQRLEHLKTAKAILKDHWIFGVGVGDVDLVFQEYYTNTNSALTKENRLRAHNQFISGWIALGLPGFLIIILWFVIPVLYKEKRDYLLMIVLLSMLVAFSFEDMLETQAGATIFALFYSLAVFRKQEEVKN